MRHRRRKFYLDKANKKLWGVCAGLADAMDWDVTFVRIGWVVATIFWAPVMIVAYIVAAWLLDDKPGEARAYDTARAHYDDARRDAYARPAAGWRFTDVKSRFDRVEDRLRTLEQVVTSREFQMDRELKGAGRV